MKESKSFNFAKRLIELSPREGKRELLAAREIMKELNHFSIDYTVQMFNNSFPQAVIARLFVDKKEIRCAGSCFVSGKIGDKSNIFSSIANNEKFSDPNINFNPYSDSISLATFYPAPSLAVSRKDILNIIKSKEIRGYVKVKKLPYKSCNILVGNINKPKNIFLTHFDSIRTGAIDNASGVAVLLASLISHPSSAKENLFVFCGAEELSYDKAEYWGFGYRVFESKYKAIFQKAGSIIVVDGVGFEKASLLKDNKLIYQAFPIKAIGKKNIANKTAVLTSGIDGLMPYYHSNEDKLDLLKDSFLSQAEDLIEKILK